MYISLSVIRSEMYAMYLYLKVFLLFGVGRPGIAT